MKTSLIGGALRDPEHEHGVTDVRAVRIRLAVELRRRSSRQGTRLSTALTTHTVSRAIQAEVDPR